MQRDEGAHEGEPDPEAALRPIGRALALHEEVEDPLSELRGQPGARVANLEHRRSVLLAHTDRHQPARRRVLEGIADEIVDDLLDPRLVDVGPGRRAFEDDVVLGESSGSPPSLQGAGREIAEIQRLAVQAHLARGQASHVEQVVHEAREVMNLTIDDGAGAIGRGTRSPGGFQHGTGAGDGAQGIPQLVAEGG
jgi:hypothetical protein